MKKLIAILAVLFFGVASSWALTLDIKVKMEDKSRLAAIEVGTMYYLNNAGINVFDIGEDKAVWLMLLKEETVGTSQRLTIQIDVTKATALIKPKQILKSKTIVVDIPSTQGQVLNSDDTSLIQFGKEKAIELKDQLFLDGKIGGQAVAEAIKQMVLPM